MRVLREEHGRAQSFSAADSGGGPVSSRLPGGQEEPIDRLAERLAGCPGFRGIEVCIDDSGSTNGFIVFVASLSCTAAQHAPAAHEGLPVKIEAQRSEYRLASHMGPTAAAHNKKCSDGPLI